jgi:aldose 1-epimerase
VTAIVELRAGSAFARIAPALGGRITAAALVGPAGTAVPVLYPYPEAETSLLPWAKGGLYPLVPYSGRIRHAHLVHEGRSVSLEPHPGSAHTLHGIAHQRAWQVRDRSKDEVVMHYHHEPDMHWPWRFQATLGVALRPAGLQVTLEILNTGTMTMPAGLGLHPYLPYAAGDALVFEAAPAWPFDADALALEPPDGDAKPQVVTAADFSAVEITRFHAGWSGTAQLRRFEGPSLHVGGDRTLSHLVLHRPVGAGYVCVEPVSHVADAFNLHARGVPGTGARTLQPGQHLSGRMLLHL